MLKSRIKPALSFYWTVDCEAKATETSLEKLRDVMEINPLLVVDFLKDAKYEIEQLQKEARASARRPKQQMSL